MANPAQIRKIRAMVSTLHLDDDDYRQMLRSVTGKESSKDLSNEEVTDVVTHLARAGAPDTTVRDEKRARKPKAGGSRTDAQMSRIKRNYAILGWHSVAQQTAWNKHCCRQSWPQTTQHATKIIVGQERYAATVLEKWSGTHREDILHHADVEITAHEAARIGAAGDDDAISSIAAAHLLLLGKHAGSNLRC